MVGGVTPNTEYRVVGRGGWWSGPGTARRWSPTRNGWALEGYARLLQLRRSRPRKEEGAISPPFLPFLP